VIDGVDGELNSEKIINDVEKYKLAPNSLIKMCSANTNPTAISSLFKHLEAKITIENKATGEGISVSEADLAILSEQVKNAITPQIKELIKGNKMSEEEIALKLMEYSKTISQREAENVVKEVRELLKDPNVKDTVLREKIDRHLDLGKVVETVIKDINAQKGKAEEDIVVDPNLKTVFENSGYGNPEALMPRLELLTQEVSGKSRLEKIQEEFYGEKGYVAQAKEFIEANKGVDGKLKEGTIDRLREKVIGMNLEGKGAEAVNLLRITLNECMLKVGYVI
jgi:hypothetical protein